MHWSRDEIANNKQVSKDKTMDACVVGKMDVLKNCLFKFGENIFVFFMRIICHFVWYEPNTTRVTKSHERNTSREQW